MIVECGVEEDILETISVDEIMLWVFIMEEYGNAFAVFELPYKPHKALEEVWGETGVSAIIIVNEEIPHFVQTVFVILDVIVVTVLKIYDVPTLSYVDSSIVVVECIPYPDVLAVPEVIVILVVFFATETGAKKGKIWWRCSLYNATHFK